MTKPQFSTEPSMEDILASIRKMISEERLGPRPIPDQIARSPFGESVVEAPAADLGAMDPIETRLERTPAPAERAQPSFSSLSDALKAATTSPEQRRSLEDKIADMLENGDAAPRRTTSPTDSLAVFAATRPSSLNAPDPLSAPQRGASPGAAPEQPTARKIPGPADGLQAPQPARSVSRAPDGQLNGVRHRERSTPSQGTPKSSGPTSSTEPNLGEPKDSASIKANTQRIIAMPPRPGATVSNGAGQATASSTAAAAAMNGAQGQGANGANVASLGLHAVPGGAPNLRPSLREGDAPTGKRPNGDADPAVTAKSGDGALRGKADDRPADARAMVAKNTQTPRDEPAKPQAAPKAEMPRPSDAAPAPVSGRTSAGQDAKPGSAPSARPQAKSAPSDALIDAVVAMVHREPDTLSVFTSGSAFIHGITGEEPVSKPGPNSGRKLDSSASELLRPMLRQWLSENMPRIVEEALRSELISSQPAPTDTDEA